MKNDISHLLIFYANICPVGKPNFGLKPENEFPVKLSLRSVWIPQIINGKIIMECDL